MDAHADLHLHAVWPGMLGERPLRRRCRLNGVPSPPKDGEEGLGLAVDNRAAVGGERLLQEAAMLRHDLLVARTEAELQLGRPLDVSEEEADRPTGQVAHVSIVTPARSDSKATPVERYAKSTTALFRAARVDLCRGVALSRPDGNSIRSG
jgi:hypothetical protein